MKRKYCAFLFVGVLSFVFQINFFAQKIIWEEIGTLPQPLFGGISVKLDTCIYLIGGQTGNMTGRLKTIYAYNFHNNTWIEQDTMQTEKLGFVAAQANNKIYAIRKNINEEYDPKTNRWITKTPIPEDNVHLSGSVINNKIYIINKNNWIYDPINDTWNNFASMNNQVGGIAVVLNDKLYIIGGLTGGRGNEKSISNFEMYDPLTNKWEKKADLPAPLFASAAVGINGKIVIIGGNTVESFENEEITDDVFMYDPLNDTWTQLNDFVFPVVWAAATVYNNYIYVFGGANDKYEPCGKVWLGKLYLDTK